MLDSGNEALAVVNEKFAQRHDLPLSHTDPIAATGFDGRGMEISTTTTFELQLAEGAHREVI